MTTQEAILNRHSVRSFTDQAIDAQTKKELESFIGKINSESGLHIQMAADEPDAFGQSKLAHYGKFNNVRNYLCMVGKKSSALEERIGYFGEQIVLRAQELGLNSCWVGLTYSKGNVKCEIAEDEKIVAVAALGYGQRRGATHKSKEPIQICKDISSAPEWFKNGVQSALLAPTAMNQQKFHFDYIKSDNGKEQVAASTSWGFYSQVDLGIAKFHFETGAGNIVIEWV